MALVVITKGSRVIAFCSPAFVVLIFAGLCLKGKGDRQSV